MFKVVSFASAFVSAMTISGKSHLDSHSLDQMSAVTTTDIDADLRNSSKNDNCKFVNYCSPGYYMEVTVNGKTRYSNCTSGKMMNN